MTTSLLLILLSLLGTLDATYLSYVHLFSSGACGAGSGCGEVLASSYSSINGIPLSAFGLGLYIAILIASWRSLHRNLRAESIRWVSLLALIGNLPTLFLLYLQAFIIGAWCPFCLLSAALVLSILILAVLDRIRNTMLQPFVGLLASRDLIPVVSTVLFVPLAFSVIETGATASTPTLELGTDVVARIGDRKITIQEMDGGIRLKLYEQRDAHRREWLERQILETAAAEKGMSAREFVQKEVHSSIEISQEEIDKKYREIKGSLPKNVTKEMVTANIRRQIGGTKSQSTLAAHVEELKKKYGTTYTPPASERFDLDPNPRGGPEKGSPDARVTIVEFSDLECGYCARAHTYLGGLLRRRGDEIRVIFRHFPLEMHEHARHAAEVAACAHKQGKFWPMADVLFREQKHLEADKITSYAERAGLDVEQLKGCLESGDGAKTVAADIAEADEIGISSTPTFFINGHYIGSLPKGGLDPLIDRELQSRR